MLDVLINPNKFFEARTRGAENLACKFPKYAFSFGEPFLSKKNIFSLINERVGEQCGHSGHHHRTPGAGRRTTHESLSTR